MLALPLQKKSMVIAGKRWLTMAVSGISPSLNPAGHGFIFYLFYNSADFAGFRRRFAVEILFTNSMTYISHGSRWSNARLKTTSFAGEIKKHSTK